MHPSPPLHLETIAPAPAHVGFVGQLDSICYKPSPIWPSMGSINHPHPWVVGLVLASLASPHEVKNAHGDGDVLSDQPGSVSNLRGVPGMILKEWCSFNIIGFKSIWQFGNFIAPAFLLFVTRGKRIQQVCNGQKKLHPYVKNQHLFNIIFPFL